MHFTLCSIVTRVYIDGYKQVSATQYQLAKTFYKFAIGLSSHFACSTLENVVYYNYMKHESAFLCMRKISAKLAAEPSCSDL